MSEKRPELFIPSVMPTRNSRVEIYFWNEVDEISEQTAEQLYDPTKPIAKTAVIIPVAAQQESGAVIARTVAQYAKQKTSEPFTVILYLICPEQYVDEDIVISNMLDVMMMQQVEYEIPSRAAQIKIRKTTA